MKAVHGPRVLHVATHGFFLDSATQASVKDGRLLVMDAAPSATPSVALENPLLRSGLAFAGANKREGGDGEDGILTALEATALDLWGTRLAVLSACETGVGEARRGEGIYGLRRALVMAGSESQLMTLVAGQRPGDAGPDDVGTIESCRRGAGQGGRTAHGSTRNARPARTQTSVLLGELHPVGRRRADGLTTDASTTAGRARSNPVPSSSNEPGSGTAEALSTNSVSTIPS